MAEINALSSREEKKWIDVGGVAGIRAVIWKDLLAEL